MGERERERKVARVSKLLAPLPRGRGKVVFGAHLQLLIATEGKIERRKEEEEVSSRLLQDSRDVLFGGNERFQTKNEQEKVLNAVPAGDQGLEIGGQTANNLN